MNRRRFSAVFSFTVIAGVMVILAALNAGTPTHPELSGVAHVIDGDTIVINDTHIRLWGIDAVERHQTCQGPYGLTYECGRDAAAVLTKMVDLHRVDCSPRDYDRYNRVVAVCRTDSVELNAEMVRGGWAIDYTRYSHGQYQIAEEQAKQAGLGIWSGRFEMPSEWRKRHGH